MRIIALSLISLLALGIVDRASATETRAGKFFDTVGVSAGSVVQVVAPSTNTDGLYIRTCSLSLTTANTGMVLFASPTAPSSPGDATTRGILNFFAGAAGSRDCPYPLYIEPGNGIWVGASGAGGLYITYDLLQ